MVEYMDFAEWVHRMAENRDKPTCTQINEVEFDDGRGGKRLVRIGDEVRPVNPDKVNWIGPAPHIVHRIFRWRCGIISFVFRQENGQEKEAYAAHFM